LEFSAGGCVPASPGGLAGVSVDVGGLGSPDDGFGSAERPELNRPADFGSPLGAAPDCCFPDSPFSI